MRRMFFQSRPKLLGGARSSGPAETGEAPQSFLDLVGVLSGGGPVGKLGATKGVWVVFVGGPPLRVAFVKSNSLILIKTSTLHLERGRPPPLAGSHFAPWPDFGRHPLRVVVPPMKFLTEFCIFKDSHSLPLIVAPPKSCLHPAGKDNPSSNVLFLTIWRGFALVFR